jgi:hypothetical protein
LDGYCASQGVAAAECPENKVLGACYLDMTYSYIYVREKREEQLLETDNAEFMIAIAISRYSTCLHALTMEPIKQSAEQCHSVPSRI